MSNYKKHDKDNDKSWEWHRTWSWRLVTIIPNNTPENLSYMNPCKGMQPNKTTFIKQGGNYSKNIISGKCNTIRSWRVWMLFHTWPIEENTKYKIHSPKNILIYIKKLLGLHFNDKEKWNFFTWMPIFSK